MLFKINIYLKPNILYLKFHYQIALLNKIIKNRYKSFKIHNIRFLYITDINHLLFNYQIINIRYQNPKDCFY